MSFQFFRQSRHLLLSGLIASVGLWAIPAQAQVSDTQVNALVEALRQAAPPNKPNDGMYSQWQVLPGIIPSWTKQCIGRELTAAQFESDGTAARNTVSCIVRREFNQRYQGGNEAAAVRATACWWMTGKDTACTSGTTASYVQKVVSFYQQARANSRPAQPSSSTQSQSTTQALPPIAEVSDSQVAALVEALRLAVSKAPKPTGLYSEWQVKAEIIPSWTKQCVGREMTPAEFDADAQTARATVTCIMRRELSRQYRDTINNEPLAVQRVASWWLTGDPNGYSSDPIASYSQKILTLYQQQRSDTSRRR